jgi:DNA repair protein RadC
VPDTATPHSPTELPRERLWALGPSALTSAELIAILLGTGEPGRGAAAVATQLLEVSGGSLRRLAARPAAELQRTPGVGPAKAARLLAAFEIAARLASEARPAALRIREPEDVVRLLGARLRDLNVEQFHLLALDSQSRVLRDVMVTRGLLNSSLVHPREVFRAAIAEAAAGAATPRRRRRTGRSPANWSTRAACWTSRSTTT